MTALGRPWEKWSGKVALGFNKLQAVQIYLLTNGLWHMYSGLWPAVIPGAVIVLHIECLFPKKVVAVSRVITKLPEGRTVTPPRSPWFIECICTLERSVFFFLECFHTSIWIFLSLSSSHLGLKYWSGWQRTGWYVCVCVCVCIRKSRSKGTCMRVHDIQRHDSFFYIILMI